MTPDAVDREARRFFAAFHAADRACVEAMLHRDFTFTSPYDDAIDRAAWFARCWPLAGTFVRHEIERVAVDGESCFMLYEGEAASGNRFRNAELFRFVDGRLHAVEVFFGRPPG